jgi:uncharacterized protein YukE
MSAFHTESERIAALSRTLQQQWEAVREAWPDDDVDRFERDFIVPLQQDVNRSVRLLDRLAQIVDLADRSTP